MKSSKKLQAFRTLLIIALVSVVILLAAALLLPVIAKDLYPNFLAYVKDVARATIGAIVFPFMKGSTYANYFAGIYETGLSVNPLIISIASYVVAGLTLIAIVIACIHFIAKKKARYLFYLLLLFALIGYSIILLGYGPLYFLNIKNLFAKVEGYTVVGIISIALFAFAAFAFLATYIGLFLLMSLAREKQAEIAEEETTFTEEERPVMSEEAVAEEVKEEAEEVAADEQVAPAAMQEYTPTYVPELEPEPTEEEEITEEKEEPVVIAEPIPDPDDNQKTNHMEVNINTAPQQTPNAFDQTSFTAMIKDMLREIVRDEIARNNAAQPQKETQPIESGDRTITGATFGGPLVVQYFNGGINGVNPETVSAPAPAPKQEEKPVEEAPKPEEKPVEEAPKEEAPVNEPAPAPVAVEQAPAVEEKEKVVYERLSFGERLLQSDKELHSIYNELKNEILSYGVKSRISANGDTFRLHKKMYVRITVAGKSLKLYFALNPDDYKDSKIPVQDAGHKGLYADIPLVFKVRSPLSIKRAKELIQDCMDKDGLEQGEIGKVNWIKELRVEVNESKKRKESNEDDED